MTRAEQIGEWITEHRLRNYVMHEGYIVEILRAGWRMDDCCDYLQLPVLEAGIPEDAFIVSVSNDWVNRRWVVMVAHGSFEQVPDGDIIPLDTDTTVRMADMKQLINVADAAKLSAWRANPSTS